MIAPATGFVREGDIILIGAVPRPVRKSRASNFPKSNLLDVLKEKNIIRGWGGSSKPDC